MLILKMKESHLLLNWKNATMIHRHINKSLNTLQRNQPARMMMIFKKCSTWLTSIYIHLMNKLISLIEKTSAKDQFVFQISSTLSFSSNSIKCGTPTISLFTILLKLVIKYSFPQSENLNFWHSCKRLQCLRRVRKRKNIHHTTV